MKAKTIDNLYSGMVAAAIVVGTVAILLLLLSGCKTANSKLPQTALAPGYTSQADEAMGETLVGAHAFYATIQADAASGKYQPSATEKTALDEFAVALNAAEILYIAYHAGTTTQAQAQLAVNSLAARQTALQATITGGK